MKKIIFFILIFGFCFFKIDSINAVSGCPTGNCGQVEAPQAGETQASPSLEGGTGLNSSTYMFPTSSFVPGGTYKGTGSTVKKVENGLVTIIQKLMIPFGVLATIVITIGGGYMILSNGDDEMLNKGKKIFKMGIFSIVIALSSYLLVELLKNLLYA